MKRIQYSWILKDLHKKLVILVGPRQAGKTWLAKQMANEFQNPVYLNYDNLQDREIICNQKWLPKTDFLVLDELHKMSAWKNYLKGIYDTKPSHLRLLVTGSARIDIYNNVGDALAGRYFKHRLLPLSLSELSQTNEEPDLERLILRGGFPEPYLAQEDIEANRWRFQYINSILSTDILEFDTIHHIKKMQLILQLLRTRVGSPISYQSLAEDVSASPITVKKYIEILEELYIVFKITPYSKNIARSLLKEPKIYFFDTGLVEGNSGIKLENFVAISLLKHATAKTDLEGTEYTIQYLRTKEHKEVDFALVCHEKVLSIIEVKESEDKISSALKYFNAKYNYPAIQLVKNLRHEYQQKSIQVLKVAEFLKSLFI